MFWSKLRLFFSLFFFSVFFCAILICHRRLVVGKLKAGYGVHVAAAQRLGRWADVLVRAVTGITGLSEMRFASSLVR